MTYKRRKRKPKARLFNPRTRVYDNPTLWNKVKRQVLKRDKYKCQFPLCRAKRKLECHHILPYASYPLIRYNPLNLITICKEHHKLVTQKETIYARMFIEIANANTKA